MKTMTKADIKSLIEVLAKERKLFWSEADFQFAFAWKIKQTFDDVKISLERRHKLPKSNKQAHVDIWVTLDGKVYPIELKYKTRTYKATDYDGEVIITENQSAQDEGRYGYLKAIDRIEQFSQANGFERGFAIMITNDKNYYEPKPEPSETVDRDFAIHEGTVVKENHTMVWHSSESWVKKYGSITLQHDYPMHWEHYNDAEDHRGDFKYVVTEITK